MTDKGRIPPPPEDKPVGYGRPPRASRFKPGQSGNPRGRPKGSKNFNTVFQEELAKTVALTENGRRRRMTKREALAKQLVNKALTNDPKAASIVVDQIRRNEGPGIGSAAMDVNQPENKLVIENIVWRIRMNQEHPSTSTPEELSKDSQ